MTVESSDPTEPFVAVRQVAIRFGETEVVAPFDLEIGRHEFVSVVGPSGCGKTSLLRMIAGLIRPSQGEVQWGKRAVGTAGGVPVRRAFVFQDPTLLPWRTVSENIRLPLELQGESRARQREEVTKAIRLVGLEEGDRGKFPRMLSGGMRMRVSLARALVTRPELILLDEPFAPLDDMLRQRLNEELLAMWARERWTAMFVTHNVAEAVFLSQRILVMGARPGRLLGEVPVDFPYPREETLRGEAEFARLTARVWKLLRDPSTHSFRVR